MTGEKIFSMKELPISERPYEKCEKCGAEALSDAELLAVIIKTGSGSINAIDLARKVLCSQEHKEGLQVLHYTSISQLKKIKGIGRVKAIQLSCIAEIAKRLSKSEDRFKAVFSTSGAVAKYFMGEMMCLTREILKVVFLDNKNKEIISKNLFTGTVNSSIVSPRELLIEALKYDAVSFILLHNHPSGDATPSKEDITVTKRVAEAGSLVGIRLLDHIIIGNGTYISLRERGIISS